MNDRCTKRFRLSRLGVMAPALICCLGGATAFGGTKVSTFVTKDVFITETAPGANFGQAPEVQIEGTTGYNHHGLLAYSLSKIPAGAAITSATLNIYAKVPSWATGTVCRIVGDWGESTVTWTSARTYAGVGWTTENSVSYGFYNPFSYGFRTLDVRGMVQDAVNSKQTELGLYFLPDSNTPDLYIQSKETIDVWNPAPSYVDITYVVPQPVTLIQDHPDYVLVRIEKKVEAPTEFQAAIEWACVNLLPDLLSNSAVDSALNSWALKIAAKGLGVFNTIMSTFVMTGGSTTTFEATATLTNEQTAGITVATTDFPLSQVREGSSFVSNVQFVQGDDTNHYWKLLLYTIPYEGATPILKASAVLNTYLIGQQWFYGDTLMLTWDKAFVVDGDGWLYVYYSDDGSNWTEWSTKRIFAVSPFAPAITRQPASQTVPAGAKANFSVAASGIGPFSYQWSKNGSNIPSATLNTYTTAPTTKADNGASFVASVTNAGGTVSSSAAILTVTETTVKGDVNRNAMLDIGDVTLVLRYIVGLSIPPASQPVSPIGDVNLNGRIDTGDATIILRKIAGLPTPY